MAKQPPAASKNKDDDSWGKLASDLLGIQFGGADDDFDLPDDEPPAAKSIPAEVAPAAVAASELKGRVAEQAPEPDLSFPEEDLSFPEDDDVSVPEKKTIAAERRPERREVAAEQGSGDEPVRDREPAKRAREDGDRDIWDALESWNFDEPHKPPVARSQSDAPAARGASRPSRADGGPRRDRDGGRERPRDRDQETPRREAPPRDQAPRAEQPPRERAPRDEVAARPVPVRRDETAPADGTPAQGRSDRGPRRRSESSGDALRSERGEAPRSEQRPPRKAPAEETRPPRSLPAQSVAVGSDDGFASGLDEEPKPRRSPAPAVIRSEAPARKPAPAVRQPDPVDDEDVFASDLFQEFVEDDDDDGDEAAGAEANSSEESSDEDRRRPRRRRRRRGGRGRRTEAEVAADGGAESNDADDDDNEDMLGFGGEDDSQADEEGAADAHPASSDDEEDDENEEGGEKRRPRRRRRRGRKRPDDQSSPVAASVGDERAGEEDDEDEDEDDGEDAVAGNSDGGRPVRPAVASVDEEPLAPVNYEGIPTWEEAISYLIRTRGPEPRGRGNSGSRGRGGAHQRR